jgi:hypothetical protein
MTQPIVWTPEQELIISKQMESTGCSRIAAVRAMRAGTKPAGFNSVKAAKGKVKTAKGEAKERERKYDVNKILALWEKGFSIREIAEKLNPISKVYTHRVLSVRFPKQYEQGQKQRTAARAEAKK